MRQPVKLGEQPIYPTTEEAIAYAEHFRTHYQQGGNDTTTTHEYFYNMAVDAYVRGCPNFHYQVYGWTVAGFEIGDISEVAGKEDWIGWVLQYIPAEARWVVLADTRTNGIAGFKEVKHQYCPKAPPTGEKWHEYEPAPIPNGEG